MGKQRLHIIRANERSILYDTESMDIFSINNISGEQLQNIINHYTLSNQYFDNIDKKKNEFLRKSQMSINKKMHRITVCVSNDCNLRCKYCYAQGGNYGNKRTLMDKITAQNFVEFCCQNYSKIDRILFFGGEPLFNYKIIEYICELFKEKAQQSSFCMPTFSLITNGTIYNDKIISLINNYISYITVSIDGSKSINDFNRVFANGSGSYDTISHFINICKEKTSVRLQFEATYTSAHIKAGISRFDVYSFLKSSFDIKGIVVDEDSLGQQNGYEYLCRITKSDIVNSKFECLPNDFWQITSSIVQKIPHKFCGIFDDRITITTGGEIVACQMLIGKENSIVGNICDSYILEKIKSHVKDFKNNKFCNECWCSSLCGGCVIQKFYSKTENQIAISPSFKLCLATQLYIEKILCLLCDIRDDAMLWRLFIEKAKTIF